MTFDSVPTPGFEIICRMTEKEARILEWLMGYDPLLIRANVTQQFDENDLKSLADSIRGGLRVPLQRLDQAHNILRHGTVHPPR